jgi:hypothetical protein
VDIQVRLDDDAYVGRLDDRAGEPDQRAFVRRVDVSVALEMARTSKAGYVGPCN